MAHFITERREDSDSARRQLSKNFRAQARWILEHTALFCLVIAASIVFALLTIGGIDLLSYVSTGNPYVYALVGYEGIEGLGIFILGSIGLLRRLSRSEWEDVRSKEGSGVDSQTKAEGAA